MVANEKPATARAREADRIELVRDAYRFIEDVQEDRRDDFDDAYAEWFDEGFELVPPPSYPEGPQVFRGRAGLRRWIAATNETWDEWWLTAERFLVTGGQVLVDVGVTARGNLSGIRLDRETAHIWHIEDGRATRCEIYLDRAKALRAVERV